jgi:hypothetical protein
MRECDCSVKKAQRIKKSKDMKNEKTRFHWNSVEFQKLMCCFFCLCVCVCVCVVYVCVCITIVL